MMESPGSRAVGEIWHLRGNRQGKQSLLISHIWLHSPHQSDTYVAQTVVIAAMRPELEDSSTGFYEKLVETSCNHTVVSRFHVEQAHPFVFLSFIQSLL